MNGALDLRNHAGGIAICTHLQCLQTAESCVLCQRHVKHVAEWSATTVVTRVLCPSHNLNRLLWNAPHLEMASYRVLIRPVFLRHGFIHDGNEGRLLIVRVPELPALDERNLHGLEVITFHELKL